MLPASSALSRGRVRGASATTLAATIAPAADALAAVEAPTATLPLDTAESIAAYIAAHDNFLLDCDGVLWAGGKPLPGAVETIEELRKAGKRVLFITNNSSSSRRQYAAKFAGFGVTVKPEDIVTSGSAMANYLSAEGITSTYVVGEDGLLEELEAVGVRCVMDAADAPAHMNEAQFSALERDTEVQAVCVGWNRSFNFRHLSIASAYLQGGLPFIGANPDAADRVGSLLFPGTGPMLAAIECASGVKPLVIGKPNPLLVKQILSTYGMDASRTAMVGDRLDTDMAFGNAGGVTSTLVLTGVSSADDLAQLPQSLAHSRPAYVMPSLSALLTALRSNGAAQ